MFSILFTGKLLSSTLSFALSTLPVNKKDYVKFASFCGKFGVFTFECDEDSEIIMGSPVNVLMVSLHRQTLETHRCNRIMGRGATWYR